MTNTTTQERSERWREGLVRRAESDPNFVAFAVAAWRQRMSPAPEELLGCAHEDLWRVALARAPTDGPKFSSDVRRIATALNISESGLARMLRFAHVSARFSSASDQGMLRAARKFDKRSED